MKTLKKANSHPSDPHFLQLFTSTSFMSSLPLYMSSASLGISAIRQQLWLHAFLPKCCLPVLGVSHRSALGHRLGWRLALSPPKPHLPNWKGNIPPLPPLAYTHVREGKPVRQATGSEQLMKNYRFDGPTRGPGCDLQQEEGVKRVGQTEPARRHSDRGTDKSSIWQKLCFLSSLVSVRTLVM